MDRGGKFTQPASSMATIRDVEVDSDPVREFLDDMISDDAGDANSHLIRDPEGKIEQPNLWAFYQNWEKNLERVRQGQVGRSLFFKRIDRMGFKRDKANGVRWVRGVYTKAKHNATV